MSRLSRLLRFALAALLLAAWQVALVHPLKHVDAHGALVHVSGNALAKTSGDKSGASPLCDAIAAVAACVTGTPALHLTANPAVDAVPARQTAVPRGALPPPYRSQAPPLLL